MEIIFALENNCWPRNGVQFFTLNFVIFNLQSTKINEDYGWKEIHGDVFRPPAHSLFFSSLVGTGLQIMVVLIGVLLGLTLGDPSKVLQTLMFVYAVTSPVNGFFGGSISAKSGVKRWISQMMVSGFLFPTIVCFIIYGLNWSATVAGERVAIKLATLVRREF